MFKSTVFEYSHSIGAKLSVQESVDEEDLSDDIDEVKYFAQEKPWKENMIENWKQLLF